MAEGVEGKGKVRATVSICSSSRLEVIRQDTFRGSRDERQGMGVDMGLRLDVPGSYRCLSSPNCPQNSLECRPLCLLSK